MSHKDYSLEELLDMFEAAVRKHEREMNGANAAEIDRIREMIFNS